MSTTPAQRRFLAVAYHFPPCKVSSGIQRALKFSDYLREYGWYASVLSVHPTAYDGRSDEQIGEIAEGVRVTRAWALDTRRHLAIAGRYPGWLALPDRWVSWWAAAVVAGLWRIRQDGVEAIWSTYPIATAHLIAGTLHRLTGLPWIADFRDSMTERDYPSDPWAWRAYRRIEQRTISRCSRAVFTTPGARRMYEERYPKAMAGKGRVIPNGYDEENFAAVERRQAETQERAPMALTLVHSGVLYPGERDPRPFFEAIARLKAKGLIDAGGLQVVLRATGHDSVHKASAEQAGVTDIVRFAPPLPYAEALAEMMRADGLLLFQAASCNHQVPAKVYEYFRSGRPVFALTDPAGDTAATLREAGLDAIVPLDDVEAIARGLAGLLEGLRTGNMQGASRDAIAAYSRRALSARLAGELDEVAGREG